MAHCKAEMLENHTYELTGPWESMVERESGKLVLCGVGNRYVEIEDAYLIWMHLCGVFSELESIPAPE